MSKKKKKVTAPLTYNPGKGRPKEHLAYLNYQEMQALKRLNGNNQERGPRGLPSFPPAGAMSGGSAKSPASTSKAAGAGSRPSSGGPRSGMSGSVSPTSGSPRGSNPSSNFGGGGSNSGSRPSGGMMGGTGSGGSSRTAASRAPSVAGRGTDPNGIGRSDKAAINAVNNANTKTALKSPAISADRSRTMNVGPMGTPVNVKTGQAGSQIKGAIKSVQEETKRSVVPKATVTSPMATQGTSFASPLDARIENFQRINDARLKSGALGPEGVLPVSRIAAENARRLNTVKMTQQYSQYRSPPTGYPAAPQGVYGPRAGVDTRYLGTTDMPGMITTSMTSPYSGTVAPRSNAASTLRAYEEAKRVPGKIQDRVPPTERFRPPSAPPSGRVAVPGLITEPSLNRPMTNADAFNQYARMVNPTDLPISRPQARAKQIQDRIIPSQNMQRPPSVGRSAVVPTDAGIIGSFTGQKQIYDRVLPESEYSGYGSFNPPSAPGKTRGIGDVPQQYPNTPPAGLSVRSPAYDPSRLAAYDSPFGPELLGASGSEIEKALLNEEFRRQAAGTVTSPYDVAPSYPNYGPPSKGLGLGGFNPVAPRNDLQRMGAGTYTSPYDVSPPQTNESVRNSYLSMMNPTIGETLTYEASPYALSEGERAAMDKLYNERMSLENTSEGVPGDETPPNDYVDGSDVYGPKNVSPEAEKKLKRDEVINKVGVNIIKFRNPLASLADAGSKLLTGKGIADSSADLKRAYMQASDEQKAALEDKYPNLTKFASDAGLTPKRDMSNYTNWAEKSGLRGAPDRRGGGENSGIRSLTRKPEGDETTTPEPDTPSTSPGRRPDIYYMWDLGVNVPSPGDPNYNQYQTYLAERLAAQRAMG